ncbi:LGFP repeat-containing protein [Mycobacterium sp. NPDC050041]|uniref:LGFP repeat-containing protein n=1 Tax=Mycobacterium sp. NPDC050041 TaxID=3364293 RepID=UPI003C2B8D3A
MSWRRTLRKAALGRAAVGLTVLAVALAPAPLAWATPETDADGAITAAWDASGGPTGPLGPRDGGVYPVGAGFAQNFAAGKMFFTPQTGAHFTQGAILEKYESLGGPADGDLGFPTIDEQPGRVSPESRNTTFSAADNPVIFWTPATGARVVRGAVNAAWDKLGGSAGPLGVPAEDEVYRGDQVSQKFTGGEVTWNRKSKAYTTVPPDLAGQLAGLQVPEDATSAINAARRAAGGALGPLGAKEGEQYTIGADGVGQDFAGGKIFYTPATGANVVSGQVLDKYESVGGPEGDLGFPTSNEADGGLGVNSRVSTFAAEDKPVIYWTPDYGPVIVRGAMNAAWSKLGGATGELGAPMADQSENGEVVTQRFSGGAVSWDRSTGKFTTEPAGLASQLAGLEVPGQQQPQAPAGGQSGDTDSKRWFERPWDQWNLWWLLALIPVLALIGLVVGAVVLSRRRGHRDDGRGDDGPFGAAGDGWYDDLNHEHAPHDEPHHEPHHDEPHHDDAALYGDRPYGGHDDNGDDGAAVPEPASPASPWDPRAAEASPFVAGQSSAGLATTAPAFEAALQENSDDVDTTPTRVEVVDETPSGRHAAIDIDEPTPGRTAIHLPVDGSNEPPEGYPIKADTRSGLYWSPESPGYQDTVAEIWFASEEFARTNGFVRAD